jgi:ubiquinone biosynthesis protein UbiJ
MATRKMTFTLPDDLADQFVRKVAARNRSRYLAQALAQKLQERDRRLIRACEVANRDPEVQAIEREFDALSEEIRQPWNDAKARRGVVGAPRSNPRVRD